MCSRYPCVQTGSVGPLWLWGSCQLTSLFHTAAIITVQNLNHAGGCITLTFKYLWIRSNVGWGNASNAVSKSTRRCLNRNAAEAQIWNKCRWYDSWNASGKLTVYPTKCCILFTFSILKHIFDLADIPRLGSGVCSHSPVIKQIPTLDTENMSTFGEAN